MLDWLADYPLIGSVLSYVHICLLSIEKSLCRCFSVVAEDRRLDLEADSEATRDLWVNAFLYLMKEYRPRILVA